MSIIRNRNRSVILSAIFNIAGLAAAFAAFYIIMVQVRYDLGYDRSIKDADRIYAVSLPSPYEEGKYMQYICRPAMEKIIGTSSLIEAGGTTGFPSETSKVYVSPDGSPNFDRLIQLRLAAISEGALSVFGFEATQGDLSELRSGRSIALSEKYAAKMGLGVGSLVATSDIRKDASGPTLNVCALYKDFRKNTHLSDIDGILLLGESGIDDWSEWSYPYYIKAGRGVTQAQLTESCQAIYLDLVRSSTLFEANDKENFESMAPTLVPLRRLYLDNVTKTLGPQGNKATTMTLLLVALLIVAIAFVNFVNLYMAMVPIVIKRVNVKKVLGSSRGALVEEIVWEATGMVALALLLSVSVVTAFSGSPAAALIVCPVALGENLVTLGITVGVAIVLAILSSLYPALYVTSFPPALALHGFFGATGTGKMLRGVLVGFQYVISICLIISALTITLQRTFLMRHDMGFNKSELLQATVGTKVWASREAMESRLRARADVKDITWTYGEVVADSRMGWGRQIGDRQIFFRCFPVSSNFLKFMGIELTQGRDFSLSDEQGENGVYIFNEAARKEFGLTLEDKVLGHNDVPADIVGFCKDFNFQGMQNGITPFALYIFGKNPWYGMPVMYVRTEENADIKGLISEIKSTASSLNPNLPEDDVDVGLFEEKLALQYSQEENLSRLIGLFTLLAILISLMGVFGLVMFETEYRRKEIGVRRVNGATPMEILLMFVGRFVWIVMVCFALAAPLSCLLLSRWLSGFAYHIPLYLWIFIVALGSVLTLTVLLVAARCWWAATANPVDSLKSE